MLPHEAGNYVMISQNHPRSKLRDIFMIIKNEKWYRNETVTARNLPAKNAISVSRIFQMKISRPGVLCIAVRATSDLGGGGEILAQEIIQCPSA